MEKTRKKTFVNLFYLQLMRLITSINGFKLNSWIRNTGQKELN